MPRHSDTSVASPQLPTTEFETFQSNHYDDATDDGLDCERERLVPNGFCPTVKNSILVASYVVEEEYNS
jgi:hypothetical protein